IDIDVETVRQRINAPHRPLLRGAGTAVENWQALVAEREPLYEQVATFRVQASNSPPSTVVNRVVDVLTGLQRAEEYAKYAHLDEGSTDRWLCGRPVLRAWARGDRGPHSTWVADETTPAQEDGRTSFTRINVDAGETSPVLVWHGLLCELPALLGN